MTNVPIDIETIPSQKEGAFEEFCETFEPKAPGTKSDIIKAMNQDPDGKLKYKKVDELSAMWMEMFGEAAKAEQQIEGFHNTCFEAETGQICSIAFMVNDEMYSSTGDDEVRILEYLWDTINDKARGAPPYFIAHNAAFDLPYIWKRSILLGVNTQYPTFAPHARTGRSHYCTMDEWTGGGKGVYIKLNKLAGLLGVGAKTEGIDGSKVWDEYKAGNLKKIDHYCRDDVYLTDRVYRKMRFMELLQQPIETIELEDVKPQAISFDQKAAETFDSELPEGF